MVELNDEPTPRVGPVRFFIGLLMALWPLLVALGLVLLVNTAALWLVDRMSLDQAAYLTFVSFLTIGFGDLTPSSGFSRVTTVLTGFAGILFMGVVVSAVIRTLQRD